MASVLLLTDRAGFESLWTAVCHQIGLTVRTHGSSEYARAVDRAAAVVIDAESAWQSADDLLGCVGFARAHGAVTALSLPPLERLAKYDDLFVELCGGLIARTQDEVPRVLSAIQRRSEADRESRFEYLASSSDGRDELLAILGDGSVVIVDRPFSADDQGDVPIEAIALSDDRRSAAISLRDGSTLELLAAELAQGRLASARATQGPLTAALGDVDGVRLGQRLRALRLAAGLTQAELARRTGIHRPNIARVEAGRHTPSLETLARLSAAIGVSTTRVLSD